MSKLGSKSVGSGRVNEVVFVDVGHGAVECKVEYNFERGSCATTDGLPENAVEGSEDGYEVLSLQVNRDVLGWVDFSELIIILEDRIIDALVSLTKEKRLG